MNKFEELKVVDLKNKLKELGLKQRTEKGFGKQIANGRKKT
jgi:hypothetical protein